MSRASDYRDDGQAQTMRPGLVALFAAATGIVVANIYYAQPLTGLINLSLGIHEGLSGVVVMLTQLSYGAGLILLVSLSDRFENRRLICGALLAAGLAAALIGTARSVPVLFAGAAAIGFFSVAVQILVPFAAHLAPPAQRGRVVGNVLGGLLVGVMLSRPVASLLAAAFDWHAVFILSAILMIVLAAVLARVLPQRHPSAGMSYGQILRSLWRLLCDTPVLRRSAAYQGLLFGVFNLFWTAVPLLLSGPGFELGQRGIAWFALAGAAGALAAPIAGRVADRGHGRLVTGMAMAAVVAGMLLTLLGYRLTSITLLVLAAMIVDAGVQTCQIACLRAIYALPGEARGRLNALYMTSVFLGGAAGSALAGWSLYAGGWILTAALGIGVGVIALLYYATEFRGRAGVSHAAD